MTPRPSIRVSFADVEAGRAYIRIGPKARTELCHLAGAPWNPKAKNAKLHPRQIEALERRERTKIIHGGSRWGKSVLGGCEQLCESMNPWAQGAVVAARYEHVAKEFRYLVMGLRELFRGIPQAFVRFKFKHQQNYHEYDIETVWGARIRGYSTDTDEGAALLGEEFSRVTLGEGSHVSQFVLERRIARAVDGWLMQSTEGMFREGGYVSMFTTPKEFLGASAAEWDRVMKTTKRRPELMHYGAVPFPETVWLREADVLENPYYDRRVYEARRKTLDPAAFKEQYQGKQTHRTGRVYKEFDDDRHVFPASSISPDEIRHMRLGVGIDTGAYFGAFLAGLDRKNVMRGLGEVYEQQSHIFDSADAVKEMICRVLGPAFKLDPEDIESTYPLLVPRVDIWAIDIASQHKLDLMEMLDVSFTGEKMDLIASIDKVRLMYQANEFLLSDDLTFTLDQLRKYIWKQVKAAGIGRGAPVITEPKKGYDHLLDAKRYVVLPLSRMGPLGEEVPALTMQEMWDQAQKERIFGPLRRLQDAAKAVGGIRI